MPEITRHIKNLSLKDLSQRRIALGEVLESENIKFSFQDSNYFFSSGDKHNSCYLFCAHYDNYRDSFGANDNMSSVCILIDLCKALEARNIYSEFLFTDGEESNHSGALSFCESHELKNYSGVINLDVCGYGDSIVLMVRGRKSAFRKFINTKAQQLKFLPDSDDIIFRKFHVPVLSLSIVPKWDVQYLKALGSFGDRLLGQPPEFEMILSQMEVTSTMHGGSKDSPEFIEAKAMTQVYDYLLDSMTAQEKHEKFSVKKFLQEVLFS